MDLCTGGLSPGRIQLGNPCSSAHLAVGATLGRAWIKLGEDVIWEYAIPPIRNMRRYPRTASKRQPCDKITIKPLTFLCPLFAFSRRWCRWPSTRGLSRVVPRRGFTSAAMSYASTNPPKLLCLQGAESLRDPVTGALVSVWLIRAGSKLSSFFLIHSNRTIRLSKSWPLAERRLTVASITPTKSPRAPTNVLSRS